MNDNLPLNNQNNQINELSLKAAYLVTKNPFLIEDDIKEISTVISLNDYLLNYKKIKISINDLLNSNEYTNNLKKRIIKKQFRHWRSEYKKQEKPFFKKMVSQKEIIKNLDYDRFSRITLFGYVFVFLILVIFFYQPDLFKESPWLFKIINKNWEQFNANTWYNLMGLTLFSFLFFVISFGFYQNIVLKTYYRRHRISRSRINHLEKATKSHFRKQYDKAKKYYLKAIKKNNITPYPLTNLIKEKYQFNQVDIVNQVALEDASRFKKNNRFFKFKRFLIHSISIILTLTFFIFMIINLG